MKQYLVVVALRFLLLGYIAGNS